MKKFVFMIEERSMEIALKKILPEFLPDDSIIIIPHEGKQDLERSIPKKLRAWKDRPEIKYNFVILRDQDCGDCKEIKNNIKELCNANGRPETLVRIVVHELESWFLGDLNAIDAAFDTNYAKNKNKRKFRNPDSISNPSQEIKRMIKNYSKLNGARKISAHLNISENSSKSFNVFISGLRRIISQEN
jgi:hypothetical protein